MQPFWTRLSLFALSALSFVLPHSAKAASVSEFYAGKTVTMLVPASVGGDVDARARLIARYMGKYIPGHPTVLPRNMPGAVGLQAANWLYNIAPRDGTVIHAVMQSMPTHQLLVGRACNSMPANSSGSAIRAMNPTRSSRGRPPVSKPSRI
jgi:tripartite-type tricarboxylate transporter receptor subunit TctC